MFSLETALQEYPVCQRRTGKHKQFVFLTPERIVKSPFKNYRIETILQRKHHLQQWQTPLVVLPDDSILRDPKLEADENSFLTYPNLAAGYPVETELSAETFSDYKYKVLKRTVLIKLSDAIKHKENAAVIGAAIPELIRALCHLYILDVGDVHFANVLIDSQKRSFHVIDFEENRSRDRDDEFFYLCKEPSQEAAFLLAKYGRPVLKQIADSLRQLPLVEAEHRIRLEKALSLLSAYSKLPIPIEKTEAGKVILPTIPVGGRTYEDYKKLTMPVLKALLDERKLRKTGNKEDLIQRLLNYDTAPTGAVPGPTGQMVWNGARGASSKTYSGFTLDVMKSALQKYIRRGLLEKALICAAELYRMHEVKGVAAQTNLMNRLAIIAVEDIGPANFPLSN